MKDRIQVQAQLYTVGVPFTAKPGDKLMVVNGVVLGIYTGNAALPVVSEEQPMKKAPFTEAAAVSQVNGKRLTKATPRPFPNVEAIVDAVKLKLDHGRWIDPIALRRLIGFPGGDEWGYMFRGAIRVLCKEKVLARQGYAATKMRYRRIDLPSTNSKVLPNDVEGQETGTNG